LGGEEKFCQIHAERISLDDAHIAPAGQPGGENLEQASIDFHGDDCAGAIRDRFGQRAEARPDLKDRIGGREFGRPENRLERTGADEEVLAPAFCGADAELPQNRARPGRRGRRASQRASRRR
jgi:hypothetical protein